MSIELGKKYLGLIFRVEEGVAILISPSEPHKNAMRKMLFNQITTEGGMFQFLANMSKQLPTDIRLERIGKRACKIELCGKTLDVATVKPLAFTEPLLLTTKPVWRLPHCRFTVDFIGDEFAAMLDPEPKGEPAALRQYMRYNAESN